MKKFIGSIILTCMCSWIFAQRYSNYISDKEVEEFLKWEASEMLNFKSNQFSIPAKIAVIRKMGKWNSSITYPKDSLKFLDLFKETFKFVELNKFLSNEEISFLKEQFDGNKENAVLGIQSREVDIFDKIPSDRTCIVYSVPLTTRDKRTFFLLKEYTWENEHGESIIQVYKKARDNGWTLYKAVSISEY